jgi:hypothetical protein
MLDASVRRHFPNRQTAVALIAALALAGGPALAQAAESPPATPRAGEPAPAIGPRLEIDQTEIDLGKIYRGETSEARFALHNTGDETLRILRAKPG